jgi:ATP phosphoribosyltransferase
VTGTPDTPLTIAVPKGRILSSLSSLFEAAGLDSEPLLRDDRRLIRETKEGTVRYVFLKPDDVPTYVEYGAADLGVCGRDTISERGFELLSPVDLRIGICRLVVATRIGARLPPVVRVATKYPRLTAAYFHKRGVQAEIIAVQGSVELAPLVGLADAIVDLVETGTTLRDNALEEREIILDVSSVVCANRAAFKLKSDRIDPLLERIRRAVR